MQRKYVFGLALLLPLFTVVLPHFVAACWNWSVLVDAGIADAVLPDMAIVDLAPVD